MKHILLLSAAYLNGGGFADIGAIVPVGDGKLEITEERAGDIILAKRAEPVEVESPALETAEPVTDEKPDFASMTVAAIGDWIVQTGGATPSGNKDAVVAAGEARWAELHPAE